jgi:hypothetical protein
MDLDHYGADLRFPEGLDRSLYMETARASASAQLMFGHGPDLLISLCKGQEWQNDIVNLTRAIIEGRYVPPGQEVVPGTAGIVSGPALAVTTRSIAAIVRDEVLPELVLHLNCTLAQSHAATVELLAPKTIFSSHLPFSPAVRNHTHPYLLTYLRKFRQSEDQLLGFTGTAQAEVTQLLFDGQKNVGYFAGTGIYNQSPLHLHLLAQLSF